MDIDGWTRSRASRPSTLLYMVINVQAVGGEGPDFTSQSKFQSTLIGCLSSGVNAAGGGRRAMGERVCRVCGVGGLNAGEGVV